MNMYYPKDKLSDADGQTGWSLRDALPQKLRTDSIRGQIIGHFEKWLDDVLSQDPGDGIAAEILDQLQNNSQATVGQEGDCDLYSLWSAMTGMTQETKLQGRSFKQLHESIVPMEGLVGSVGPMLKKLDEMLEQSNETLIKSAQQQAHTEVADLLIDIRDRLIRGLQAVQKFLSQSSRSTKPEVFIRIFGRRSREHTEAVAALAKGYTLTLERLNEAIEQFGISEIDCLNQTFNPELMTAVDIEEDSQEQDGTVLEVYRTGYKWHDQVHRIAEVKVARNLHNLQYQARAD